MSETKEEKKAKPKKRKPKIPHREDVIREQLAQAAIARVVTKK